MQIGFSVFLNVHLEEHGSAGQEDETKQLLKTAHLVNNP